MIATLIPITDLYGWLYKKIAGRSYYTSKRWRSKRKQCFEMYGKRCKICKAEENLHVHHNNYLRFGREYIRDLTPLCASCHTKEHKK